MAEQNTGNGFGKLFDFRSGQRMDPNSPNYRFRVVMQDKQTIDEQFFAVKREFAQYINVLITNLTNTLAVYRESFSDGTTQTPRHRKQQELVWKNQIEKFIGFCETFKEILVGLTNSPQVDQSVVTVEIKKSLKYLDEFFPSFPSLTQLSEGSESTINKLRDLQKLFNEENN